MSKLENSKKTINHHLIGEPGSVAQLATPALIIQKDVFDANVQAMKEHCARNGLSLRPHSKTHKSVTIAKIQIKAGAVGVCCAKLGEAEVMSAGGIESILITSPLITAQAVARLMTLNAKTPDLMVVVDHPENVETLAAAAVSAGKPLSVLIDLDIGLHRTGIAPGEGALELAQDIARHASLTFKGLQAYAGHLMHIDEFEERRKKSLEEMQRLKTMRDALKELEIDCAIISGGGTGTYNIDPEANVLTELQGGSYIFMDRQYNAVLGPKDTPPLFDASLFVQMTVVSKNTPGIVTTDAGFKSFATDAEDPPQLVAGAPEGANFFFFGDEQGGIFLPDGQDLALGHVLTALTPHCDPTVNLYDVYHVVEGDMLIDIWPIEARGCSS